MIPVQRAYLFPRGEVAGGNAQRKVQEGRPGRSLEFKDSPIRKSLEGGAIISNRPRSMPFAHWVSACTEGKKKKKTYRAYQKGDTNLVSAVVWSDNLHSLEKKKEAAHLFATVERRGRLAV